jgi:quercetin dioxygenase-like cupin family protein
VNFTADKKTYILRPGAYVRMPRDTLHSGHTTGGMLIQVKMDGPFTVTYPNKPPTTIPAGTCH